MRWRAYPLLRGWTVRVVFFIYNDLREMISKVLTHIHDELRDFFLSFFSQDHSLKGPKKGRGFSNIFFLSQDNFIIGIK